MRRRQQKWQIQPAKAAKCKTHTTDKVGGNNSSLKVGWGTSRKVEKDTNRTTVQQHEWKNSNGDERSVYDREKSNQITANLMLWYMCWWCAKLRPHQAPARGKEAWKWRLWPRNNSQLWVQGKELEETLPTDSVCGPAWQSWGKSLEKRSTWNFWGNTRCTWCRKTRLEEKVGVRLEKERQIRVAALHWSSDHVRATDAMYEIASAGVGAVRKVEGGSAGGWLENNRLLRCH